MNKAIYTVDLNKILATREREIFNCIIIGMRTKEIGDKFNIKANTVSTIKKVIYKKLNVSTSIELYKIAHELHLV
jgi:DNA-binding NarL/FixJ family response regulator